MDPWVGIVENEEGDVSTDVVIVSGTGHGGGIHVPAARPRGSARRANSAAADPNAQPNNDDDSAPLFSGTGKAMNAIAYKRAQSKGPDNPPPRPNARDGKPGRYAVVAAQAFRKAWPKAPRGRVQSPRLRPTPPTAEPPTPRDNPTNDDPNILPQQQFQSRPPTSEHMRQQQQTRPGRPEKKGRSFTRFEHWSIARFEFSKEPFSRQAPAETNEGRRREGRTSSIRA